MTAKINGLHISTNDTLHAMKDTIQKNNKEINEANEIVNRIADDSISRKIDQLDENVQQSGEAVGISKAYLRISLSLSSAGESLCNLKYLVRILFIVNER